MNSSLNKNTNQNFKFFNTGNLEYIVRDLSQEFSLQFAQTAMSTNSDKTASFRYNLLLESSNVKKQFDLIKINLLSSAQKKMLDLVYSAIDKFGSMFMAQDTMAFLKGYKCRETANRALKVLKEKGLIKRQRRFNKSNIYTLDLMFEDQEFLEDVRKILPSVNRVLFRNVTLYYLFGRKNLNNNLYKKEHPTSSIKNFVEFRIQKIKKTIQNVIDLWIKDDPSLAQYICGAS